MHALTKLSELPLTEIPDIKKTVQLGLSREQTQFLKEFFELLQASAQDWDKQFKDLERGIVANLQHCLSVEEEACEGEYRAEAENALIGNSFVISGTADLVGRRVKVLWAMQEIADQEAGQATPVSLIRPFHLLAPEKISFLKERHLHYVTAVEMPEIRLKSHQTLKKLSNIELRQRYLEICRKRLLGFAVQHQYLPTAPAAYSAQDISWEQLAFEWLETRYDSLFNPEYIQGDLGKDVPKPGSDPLMVGLLYRWSQSAFLAAACDICFLFEEQKEQWKRGIKILPDMDLKTIIKHLQTLKERLEKGKVQWEASLKTEEWRQFLDNWRLLKESLEELKQIVEQHKAALVVASLQSPKGATPPTSPPRALPPALSIPAPLSSRPASLDTRQEMGSPRLMVASPRRLLFSPRPGSVESEITSSPRPKPLSVSQRRDDPKKDEHHPAVASRSSSSRPINIPPFKQAAGKGPFSVSIDPPNVESGQSPGRGRTGSGSLANLLRRVDSQSHLKMQSPRKTNKLLTNFCSAIELKLEIMNLVEEAMKPALTQAAKRPVTASPGAAPAQSVLIFDPEPQATNNARLLLELLQYAEQVCSEMCEQFDMGRPLEFVLDHEKQLEIQQKKDDKVMGDQLQDKQKEFWEQSRPLLRYHHELLECYKRQKPPCGELEQWQNAVKRNQSFLEFHKMAFDKPADREPDQLINRWKDIYKDNKLLSDHYKEQPLKQRPSLEELMDEVRDRFLDLWAYEAFDFQRKFALQRGLRRTIQLLEADLATPCPDRALKVMCNRKRFTQEAVTMSADELIKSIHAKSLLSLLRLHLGVGAINRETPEYEYVGSLLSYIKQRAAPAKAKVPFLAEQIKDQKKIRFTFPVSQAERVKELAGLLPEERLYLEGSELADLYAILQQLRDPLSQYQTFGAMLNAPQPLEKILERVASIQESTKSKPEKHELLAQQELLWEQYVAPGTHQRLQQKMVRDSLRNGIEMVSRYLGNLAAFAKTRAKLQKGNSGSQIKADKQAKRRSNIEPAGLRSSLGQLGQLLGLAKPAEAEAQTATPEKLRRKIVKKIMVALPPLANAVFTLPPPGMQKK